MFDSSERDSRAYKFSCDGTAEAASKAIKTRLDLVFNLANLDSQARIVGYNHTGLRLDMADQTQYVVDWWKSLDVSNPILFHYDDFMYNRGHWVSCELFRGFP